MACSMLRTAAPLCRISQQLLQCRRTISVPIRRSTTLTGSSVPKPITETPWELEEKIIKGTNSGKFAELKASWTQMAMEFSSLTTYTLSKPLYTIPAFCFMALYGYHKRQTVSSKKQFLQIFQLLLKQ